jgi:predicted secreted protein
MPDARSNRIAVVCHCILNVHSLEENLAEYKGLEEEVIEALIEKGLGIVQLKCPETWLHGVERLPMPKDTYDKPHIRESYSALALEEILQLKEFMKNGAEIKVIIGAEASPSCGATVVSQWKRESIVETRKFPQDVDFIPGRGVYMEELEKLLELEGIKPAWIGVPGKSIKSEFPEMFQQTLKKIRAL